MSSADVDAHGISGAGGHANHASSDCGYVLLVAALLVMVTLAMTAILLSFVANHDDTRVKKLMVVQIVLVVVAVTMLRIPMIEMLVVLAVKLVLRGAGKSATIVAVWCW